MHADLRAAIRLLIRRPGFGLTIVLTLAVALGAFAAIFSLVNALMLRPLPFEDSDRIVLVEAVVGTDDGRMALREYRDLSRDTQLFEHWAAYYRSQYNVTGGGPPEALTCTIASSTLFKALGVRPLIGDLWPEEQDFTRQYQVLLSHGLWQRRFGGRRDVVGSTIVMDGANYQVTGVLPPGFDYPLQTDVVRAVTDYNAPHVRRYSVLARLRANLTLPQAQAELDAFAARFAETYPDTNLGVSLRATPLRDAYLGNARPFLWLLLVAVVLVLVIASVNITNLLLSRALASSGDFAVRLALGAGKAQLIRQSVVEALLLTGIGAVLGAVAAPFALRGLTSMVQSALPPWFHVEVDAVVLVSVALVAVLTGIVVGAWPALQASRANVEGALRENTSRTAGSARQQWIRRSLIGGQAMLAAVLLVAAGVLMAGVRELLRLDTGFDAANVLTFRADPPFARYPDIATTSEFYRRATERLAALPEVESVGTNTVLPFSQLDAVSPRVSMDGQTAREEERFVNFQIIGPEYFDAMRIPVLAGRRFERTDTERSMPVAVVSARAARQFWPREDPIGRKLQVVWNQQGVGAGGGSTLALTVVGVVGDVRFGDVDDVASLSLYAPNTQLFAGDSFFVVRTRLRADAVRSQIRAAFDAVDPEQSFFDVQPMTSRIERVLWPHRVATAILGVFGAIALGLAAVGTYAVTAHAVVSQQREVAIRLALGASAPTIVWLVMRRWLAPVALGVTAGLGTGLVLARLLGQRLGLLGDTVTSVPIVLSLLLAGATIVACWVPVWQLLRRVHLTDTLRATP
jgi:putative ABC transport system permease protein